MGILVLSFVGLGGFFLLGIVGISLVIGMVYFLFFIWLKRFFVLAVLCIFIVWGVIVNLGIFLSFVWGFEKVEEVLGGLIKWMGELGEVVLF